MITTRPKHRVRSAGRTRPLCWLLALMIIAATTLGAVPETPKAAAEQPQSLDVIPALTQWSGELGTFRLTDRSSIVYGQRELRETARTFAADLEAQDSERHLRVRPGGRSAHPGDIIIDIDRDATDLGPEGYRVEVDEEVRVTAMTDDGAFHATRTLLQLLAAGDHLAYGQGKDIPAYQDRGIAVCPCALKISLPWMERLIKEMSFLKLRYLLIPLKMKSSKHPEINQWAYYTPEEAREIARLAKKYHVNVIPEINAPGHMEPFLFDREDLQLTDRDGVRSPGRIDITKPEALDFYTDLIDEYATIFDVPEWHLGADEYMLSSSYDQYPQIEEYAKELFGPDAEPEDAFIHFVNQVDDHLREKQGMKLRIWNDGLPRRNTVEAAGAHPQLNRDITVEHWTPGHVTPAELLDAGYSVTNAASSLYDDSGGRVSGHDLCPEAGRLDACMPTLWESGWDPTEFEGGEVVPPTSRGLTGAHLSLWQSVPTADTENMLERGLFMPLRVLAERTWNEGGKPDLPYADFVDRAKRLGHAPGWSSREQRQPLGDGTYTLRSTGKVLAAESAAPDSPLQLATGNARWQLNGTDDGYYTIASPATGLCAAMPDASVAELLNGQPGVGAPATMQACNPASQLQKWEIGRRPGGGFTLTNAIHQMPTSINTDGHVTQRPPDQATPMSWQIGDRDPATLQVETSSELLKAGEANAVTASFTNHGTTTMPAVTARLSAPSGWAVDPTQASLGDVAPGATETATFSVTPPAGAPADSAVTLTATAEYGNDQGPESIKGSVHTRIDPISCATPGQRPSPDDDFDDVELNGCRWSAVQDPDLDALQLADSHLQIETQPGDLVNQTGTSITNLLLQPAGQDNFTIETEMQAPLLERYQQAGLMIHQDDDNYVEMALVADNAPGEQSRLYLSLVSEQDGVFRKGGAVNVFDLPPSPDDHWSLRLTKRGDVFTAAYSTDGKSWTAMPDDVTNPVINNASVGLFVTGPGQSDPTTVAFDSFHLRNNR